MPPPPLLLFKFTFLYNPMFHYNTRHSYDLNGLKSKCIVWRIDLVFLIMSFWLCWPSAQKEEKVLKNTGLGENDALWRHHDVIVACILLKSIQGQELQKCPREIRLKSPPVKIWRLGSTQVSRNTSLTRDANRSRTVSCLTYIDKSAFLHDIACSASNILQQWHVDNVFIVFPTIVTWPESFTLIGYWIYYCRCAAVYLFGKKPEFF